MLVVKFILYVYLLQKAHGQEQDVVFLCNYATKVLDLEQINLQLSKRMELTKSYCIEVQIEKLLRSLN